MARETNRVSDHRCDKQFFTFLTIGILNRIL